MIGGLTLYLWILVPASLFLALVGYLALMGYRTRSVIFRAGSGGPPRSRAGMLANVVSRDHPAAVIETAPAVAGPQRPGV
ncbi:hypothetical protein HUT06_12125 [Actinomadura sp. NAK00032]|uniref:hypothetical protein n=1 Tax=Actinomadura sp. NAK00032 TaxID=2742128 RepID=UPI0015905918|nr:hypothetical protein [Actinomadura sp. NAK00032]QKW34682.1 hypothetical protein HUT06_12125 [Actinomadura sp. NAK00032]